MKITDLINIINSSSYEDRQTLIDSLYSPKVLTTKEKQDKESNDFNELVKKVNKKLESLNLKAPKQVKADEYIDIMTNYLKDFEDDLQEYEMLINANRDLTNVLQISLYYLTSGLIA